MSSGKKVKGLRIFFGVIIALVVLFFIVAFCCGWYVRRHLPEWVLKATDSAYHVSTADVSVNLISGNITATDLELKPDTARLLALAKDGHPQKVAITLTIPKVLISGFSCIRLAKKHELSCNDILIWEPKVLVKPVPDANKHERQEKKQGAIKGIFAGQVQIVKPDVMYRAKDKDDDSIICHVWGGNARLDDLQLIPGKVDTTRVLLSRTLQIDSSAFSFDKKKAKYKVEVPVFYANTTEKRLRIERFHISPKMNHEEFYKTLGHRTTILDVYIANAVAKDLDWLRLLHDHHEVSIENLQVFSPVINLYFDYNQPSKKGNVVDKDPNNILRLLPVKLLVKRLDIAEGHLAYTEKSNESHKEATVLFEKIKGYGKNISNVKAALEHDGECVISLEGIFMHRTNMNATMHMNLADTLGPYTIEGTMIGGDAQEINPITRNLSLIQVDSLHLTHMETRLKGNAKHVNGYLSVEYENLKAELLKIVPVDSLKDRKFVSFVANTFFVYHDNPMPGRKLRTTSTDQDRDPEVPFIATLVKNIKHNGRKIIIKDEPVVDVVTGDTKDLPPAIQKKTGFFKRLFGGKKSK